MRLYNSLSRKIEKFEPINPPQVGLYACGPTVYDYAHLGHLRKYTMDDVLVRVLKREGYSVTHVQNVTDVGHLASDADTGEDKLEKGARKYSLSVLELAHKFENYFYDSMDKMNNQRPDIVCRATAHIQEMLALVEILEAKGFTYVIEGDGVYFDTSKLSDYGALSPLDLDQIQAGARVEMAVGKRNATDFALWKFEREVENRAMSWPSKWAEKGFPGWHIECSAMSMKYLGEQFDIHTGGIDHLTVHHPNEIAQSEVATNKKPFVKYWVHHNFLQVDGKKMSKSKNNFFTIDDIETRGFNPMALRLLFLQSHYRSELNFTWDSLAATQKSWMRLQRLVGELKAEAEEELSLSPLAIEYQKHFFEAMADDLDTPTAVADMWKLLKDERLSHNNKYWLLMQFDEVLGLGLANLVFKEMEISLESLPAEIQALVQARAKARAAKDWGKADELRAELSASGYQVLDTTSGQKITKK